MASYLSVACRCIVGLVFVLAVAGKVRNRAALNAFVESVRSLLPGVLLHQPIAVATIAFEALVPVLLVIPGTALVGVVLAAAVLLAFTVAIVAALSRGSNDPCRCFGTSTTPLGRRHVLRNALLLTATAGAAIPVPETGHPAGIALALFAGGCAAAVITRFDEIADLLLPARPTVLRSSK